MSWRRRIMLFCDAPDCCEWVNTSCASVEAARRDAKGWGWSSAHGKDYCVEHEHLAARL